MLSLLLVGSALALPPDPADALRVVDARALAMEAVRYSAIRTTRQNEATREERWVYASEPAGHFRIDYVGDTPRYLACDGHVLWDYIPAMHAAQKLNLDQMSGAERTKALGGVLSKVAIPGLRTGIEAADMSTVSWGPDGSSEGRPTRTVVATDEKGGRLTWVLDAEHGYLVSSRIEQNDAFVVDTVGSAFREVAPDLWIPMRVVSTSPGPGGKVRVQLDLLQVVLGSDLPDNLFRLELDPSVSVRALP